MNQKEISELRRRFRPEKSNIRSVYGCYVNSQKEVISWIEAPLGRLPQEEAEQYLGLLKKALSGTLGKNLIEIVFTTQQVMDSDEHRLLSALRDSQLQDGAAQQAFFERVVASLDLAEGNCLVLLAHDTYEVPYRSTDDEVQPDASDELFSYIICCVCPVRDGKGGLGFCPGENEFHTCASNQMVGPPELGFVFPAFNDRAADLYSALFYTRRPEDLHPAFLDAIFRTEPPLSAPAQQEAFHAALADALEGGQGIEVVQALHESLSEQLEQHKESKSPEPLTIPVRRMGELLQGCGVAEEKAAAFCESCREQFGPDAALSPANLIDPKRFEVKTADVTVSVSPEQSALVETRVIDGRRYLLIPVDETLTVNGIPVG